MKMDKYVIPLVEYFNNNSLKTWMSCQGHNTTNKSMYWISFNESITEQDIINFQMKHLQKPFQNYPSGGFASNGYFAQRLFVDARNIPIKYWCYCAATIEAALDDLNRWELEDKNAIVAQENFYEIFRKI